jgi:hypothetical protein
MPVVPPMVSATTGALLVPHTPAGQLRLALLLGCYAMLGLGLIATLLVVAMIYGRLVHHEAPTGSVVPTVWIGVGALGQSVTALGALAAVAPSVLQALYARGTAVFALLGGIAVWGFAMLWLALATGLTARTIRAGLPFAPTWWSFIFPVGACVTATGTLAARTGSEPLVWIGVVFYALLVIAWLVVASHSLRHAARHTRRRPRARHSRRRLGEPDLRPGAANVLTAPPAQLLTAARSPRPVSPSMTWPAASQASHTAEDGSYAFTNLEADRFTLVAAGYPAQATPLTLDSSGQDTFGLTPAHEEG